MTDLTAIKEDKQELCYQLEKLIEAFCKKHPEVELGISVTIEKFYTEDSEKPFGIEVDVKADASYKI